ncbi:hypothetical protein OIU74_025528 [Salix koriyanagi]|uniref:Uncharacterized protein n=1 Tax=Salix koriyanagi TaxID=2511006 RepID=A0A9Q0W201_9ROSI|nr:hypothetical protein OIU74_025528 [Salix koriyanagi]
MKVEKVQSGAPNPICTSGRCSIPEVEKGVALARKLRKSRVGLRIQAAPQDDVLPRNLEANIYMEMNCFLESRDCFDSFAQPGGHPFQVGSAVDRMLRSQNLVPYGQGSVLKGIVFGSRHYPVISAGKLNLRQLNTLSY